MGATRIEFRLRTAIMLSIIVLGFLSPWLWETGDRIPLYAWLALTLNRLGLISFGAAAPLTIGLATLFAAIAVIFRIWGTAYLGPAIVQHGQMRAGALLVGGPYRYVRNPLYIGLWSMTVALVFLMPLTGALFVLIAVPFFLMRLICGEDAFLTGQLGEPYQEYLRAVPRLLPRLRSTLPPSGVKPHWLRAALFEITPIGVFSALAFFSWSYNSRLMAKVILISFGLSLLMRAFAPSETQATEAAS